MTSLPVPSWLPRLGNFRLELTNPACSVILGCVRADHNARSL